MPTPRDLLDPLIVAFDGSPPSRAAAEWAARLAGTGRQVRLAEAVGLPPPDAGDGWMQVSLAAAARLDRAARAIGGRAEGRVLHGEVVPALVAEAEHGGLLLVGSHGLGALAERVLGSVTTRLLLEAPCPMLVASTPPPVAPRVLAAVEDHPRSERVAEVAAMLGRTLSAEVTLVTVVPSERHPGVGALEWREALGAHTEGVFRGLRAIAPGAEELLRFGDPEGVLRELAGERPSLLVVGRRGRSGVDVDEGGSLAYRLAARGPYATVVV